MRKEKIGQIDCYFSDEKRFKTLNISICFIKPLELNYLAEKSLLTRLMTSATKNYPIEEDFSYMLDDLYETNIDAYASMYGKMYLLRFDLRMINPKYIGSEVLEKGIKLLKEVLFNPLFDEEKLDKEKVLTIESINERYNNKSRYAIHQFFKLMFKDELPSIEINGNKEEIRNVTIDKLKAAYFDLINTPCVLFVNGDVDCDECKNINSYLEDLLNTPLVSYKYKQEYEYIDNYIKEIVEVNEKIEEKNSKQSVICIGFRSSDYLDDDKKIAFSILSDMLGGYFHSSLIQLIREEKSLAYTVVSDYSLIKGYMNIYAQISKENAQIVKDLVLKTIDEYKNKDIDKKVLDLTIETKVSEMLKRDDVGGYNNINFLNEIRGRKQSIIEEQISTLNKITLDDIAAAASNLKLDTIYLLKGVENG